MDEFTPEHLPNAIQKGIRWGIASIILFFVILIGFQLTDLHSEVSWNDIHWGLLFVGWCAMCSALIALGYRWAALLPALVTRKAEPLFFSACLCSALLLNYAIPGPFGELAAAWFIHKRYKITMIQAIVTATAARLIGLATAALGVLVLWSGVAIRDELLMWIQIVVYGVGAGLGILLLLMYLPHSWRLRLEKKSNKSKVFSMLHQFAQAFLELRSFLVLLKSVFWSFVGHLLAFVGVWVSIYSVFGEQEPIGIAFSYLMGTCVGAVAFLFPGSQLTWDASLATLLYSTTGLTPADATVMTVILRMEQLAMMLLGAIAVIWVQSRLSKSD